MKRKPVYAKPNGNGWAAAKAELSRLNCKLTDEQEQQVGSFDMGKLRFTRMQMPPCAADLTGSGIAVTAL